MRRIILCAGLVASTILSFAVTRAASPSWGDSYISRQAGPWPIEIRTCARFAGAICSLRWRNREFIDIADHGRELQSATSFDGHGEAFNPTEAGSSWDGSGYTSSSVLQGLWTAGNVLATQTRMAFWLRPGETSPYSGPAVNTTVLSNHILNKQVTIGLPGMAHVIEYRTQFTIPAEGHFHGVMEVVTAYMPTQFSSFYTYDVATRTLSTLSNGPGEQSLPIIFSTSDGGWAMGIYSPPHSQASPTAPGYGRFRFPDVVKWNAVYRLDNPVGTYHFVSYIIVGSLENVIVSMDQLRASGY